MLGSQHVTGTTTWNVISYTCVGLVVGEKGLGPIWDSSQHNEWLLSGKWRPGDVLNEKIDDHLCEHDNDQVVIAPTVWSSPCIAPIYPAHLSHCSLQLPPPPKPHSNANPCPEHKGSLCEVFTYPQLPTSPLPPQPGSLPQCGWCAPFAGWWTERDKAKVHTPFLFTWQGGQLDPAGLLRGHLPCATAGCWLLALLLLLLLLALQFVPSFKASHASVVLMP